MKHETNMELVKQFLIANPKSGYNYEEIAKATQVSKSAIKNIIRDLIHNEQVDRFIQREVKWRGRRKIIEEVAYFAWKTQKEVIKSQNSIESTTQGK